MCNPDEIPGFYLLVSFLSTKTLLIVRLVAAVVVIGNEQQNSVMFPLSILKLTTSSHLTQPHFYSREIQHA